jgi:hypothetical protein
MMRVKPKRLGVLFGLNFTKKICGADENVGNPMSLPFWHGV